MLSLAAKIQALKKGIAKGDKRKKKEVNEKFWKGVVNISPEAVEDLHENRV